MMAEACAICPNAGCRDIKFKDGLSLETCEELFHQPCSTCEAKAVNPRLCVRCQHLRLRHMFTCVNPENLKDISFAFSPALIKESFTSDCPCCSIIRHTILSVTSETELVKLRNEDICIILSGVHQIPQKQSQITIMHELLDDRGNEVFSYRPYMALVDEPDQGLPRLPMLAGYVDWGFFRQKEQECRAMHVACMQAPVGHLPRSFRVIDVMHRCLVHVSECQYVALSYVWGRESAQTILRATKATIGQLQARGGLQKLKVPAIIEDAMMVCMKVGQRYLWADRLCIIQDDEDDRHTQMSAMAEIFSRAQLVLIAEHGDSMLQGLAGVSVPRKTVQRSVDIDGVRITNVPRDVMGIDPQKVWHTRGWTYQEAILASRRLYFCRYRAWFECKQAAYHEDRFDLGKVRSHIPARSMKLVAPDESTTFEPYSRHVMQYSERYLTYASDIYDAVSGIVNSLYASKGKILYGMPTADFDKAMLWLAWGDRPEFVDEAAICKMKAPEVICPSWSWSSSMYLPRSVMYHRLPFYGSLVDWHSLNGAFQILNDCKQCPRDGDWEIYWAYACAHGCVEGLDMHLDLATHSFSEVKTAIHYSEKEADICDNAISDANTNVPNRYRKIQDSINTTVPEAVSSYAHPQSLLITRWQRAFLRIKETQKHNPALMNLAGDIIGQTRGWILPSHRRFFDQDWTPDAVYEFGAISLCSTAIFRSEGEENAKRLRDREDHVSEKIPFVYVMMVRREGAVQRRMTLGVVYLTEWVKLKREWVDVILG